MRQRRSWMLLAMLLVWTALYLVALRSARGQTAPLPEEPAIHVGDRPVTNGGVDQNRDPRSFERVGATDGDKKVIVIGFVGGFVKVDDVNHPEGRFAAFLRERYGVAAAVFGNHDRHKALREVLLHLDTNQDGALSPVEKEQARIIIYGHSWGASERSR